MAFPSTLYLSCYIIKFLHNRDRVCIKIPVTPESVVACAQLTSLGIKTLGTCLFSVAQAVAASQAGCLYVAPYFNGKCLASTTLVPTDTFGRAAGSL